MPYKDCVYNGYTYYLHKTHQNGREGRLSWNALSKGAQDEWTAAAIRANISDVDLISGFKQNVRNYDGRGPFGSKHRSKPLDVSTVKAALDKQGPTLVEYWGRKNIHKWKKTFGQPKPLFDPSDAGQVNFATVRLNGERCHRCYRRRVALLNTLRSFRSEVKNQWFAKGGEKEGLAIGIEYVMGESIETTWFILVLVSRFGVGIRVSDIFYF